MWIIITVSCNGQNIKAKSDVIRKTRAIQVPCEKLHTTNPGTEPGYVHASQTLERSCEIQRVTSNYNAHLLKPENIPTGTSSVLWVVEQNFSRFYSPLYCALAACIVVVHISSFITSNNKVFSLQLSHMLNTRKGIVPFLQVQLYQSKPRRPSLHDTVTALWSSEEVLNSSWLKGDFKKQARFRPWISSIQHIQSD